MKIGKIIENQGNGYYKFHQCRLNLLIHVFTVPLFIIGSCITIKSIFSHDLITLLFSLITMAGAIGAQGIGHKKEKIATEPFTSLTNAILRIFLEQFYTFPKYIISGKLYVQFRKNS